MRVTLDKRSNLYAGPLGFVAQMVVMTLATILSAYLLPGVRVDSVMAAVVTAAVIALLDTFIRPILIVITLPFTVVSMGLFLVVVNALIILMAAGLVDSFHVNGVGSAILFSILLTVFNYLLEIPNRMMRRPRYKPSDEEQGDDHTDTDANGFARYEEVESTLNEAEDTYETDDKE